MSSQSHRKILHQIQNKNFVFTVFPSDKKKSLNNSKKSSNNQQPQQQQPPHQQQQQQQQQHVLIELSKMYLPLSLKLPSSFSKYLSWKKCYTVPLMCGLCFIGGYIIGKKYPFF